MADIIDTANDAAELFLADSIAHSQHKPLPLTGFCHNCDEPVPGHFCDKDCSLDYEYRVNTLKKQGLA